MFGADFDRIRSGRRGIDRQFYSNSRSYFGMPSLVNPV